MSTPLAQKVEHTETRKPAGWRGGHAGEKHHLGFLDGIRGGAALWVLVAHCAIWGGWFGITVPPPKFAVDIFMVVSGFLMVYQYRSREKLEPLDSWHTAKRFWLRRFFRIAPIYYVFLAFLYVFWQPYIHGWTVLQTMAPERWAVVPQYNPANYNVDWENTLIHATFLFGLLPKFASSNMSADWSIGLEMQFYAAFPLLFFALRRLSWISMAIGALVLSVACNHVFAHLPGPVPGARGLFSEPSFLLMKLPVFLTGMLAGEVFCQTGRTSRQRALMTVCAFALAAHYSVYVATAVAVMFWLAWCHEPAPDSEGNAIRHWVNRLLSNRLAVFMADTSYCVYLCHGSFISLLGGYLFQQARFLSLSPLERIVIFTAIVCAGAYLLAWILHHLIEKPCIELGRRLTNRWFPVLKVTNASPIPPSVAEVR